MAMFVHLTPESRVKAILRNGIRRLRKPSGRPSGVFAMPVTRNFHVSHQWLRELRRRNQGTIAGVYFRIPDYQRVWIGHYNQAHQAMTAAQACALVMAAEVREGFEVIIPRAVGPNEIHRVRSLRQVVGWRYWPGSHGKQPCGCPFCQRGQYGARKLRERYEEKQGGGTGALNDRA
jgi:hypothetical protein